MICGRSPEGDGRGVAFPWGPREDSATERPRGDGSGRDDLDSDLEEASGESALTGDAVACVKGVRAAMVVEEWPLVFESFVLALKTDETVLARELVEPMALSKSPESRASESDEDMLARASAGRSCRWAMRS
jgi:hypothetical protein